MHLKRFRRRKSIGWRRKRLAIITLEEKSMPTNLNRAIANKLQAAQVAIFNTPGDADLQTAVAAFGYGPDKLREGEQVYQRAVAAVDARALAWAAQKAATAQLQTVRLALNEAYQLVAKVARVVLTDSELVALGLNRKGGMPRQAVELWDAAGLLFSNARKAGTIGAKLAEVGVGPEALDRATAVLEAWQSARFVRDNAIRDGKTATDEQAAALRDLTVWVATYIKIARIALRDQPALLEKLGVKVRAGRSAAQVAGRQKAAATRKANRAARAAETSEPIGELGRNLVQ